MQQSPVAPRSPRAAPRPAGICIVRFRRSATGDVFPRGLRRILLNFVKNGDHPHDWRAATNQFAILYEGRFVLSCQPCDFHPPNTKCLTDPFPLAAWKNGLPVIFAVVTLTFDPCVAEVELVV